jgi:hypothetical protein
MGRFGRPGREGRRRGQLAPVGVVNVSVPSAVPSSKAASQRLRRVRLVSEEPVDTAALEREFCTVVAEHAVTAGGADIVVDDVAWHGAFDLTRFDEPIEHAMSVVPSPVITVRGDAAGPVACQVLSRYQRFIRRRNAASSTSLFDAALDAHAALHDLSDPQSRCEHAYALDTWQWMLRLDAQASLPAQLAALLHAIAWSEDAEGDRLEHRSTGHPLAEATRARAAQRSFEIVRRLGLSDAESARVREIVRRHERDADSLLLDDADALAFLSLRSSRYADHFGMAQTRRKLAYTVSRLGPVAREKLAHVRLRPDIERVLHRASS